MLLKWKQSLLPFGTKSDYKQLKVLAQRHWRISPSSSFEMWEGHRETSNSKHEAAIHKASFKFKVPSPRVNAFFSSVGPGLYRKVLTFQTDNLTSLVMILDPLRTLESKLALRQPPTQQPSRSYRTKGWKLLPTRHDRPGQKYKIASEKDVTGQTKQHLVNQGLGTQDLIMF